MTTTTKIQNQARGKVISVAIAFILGALGGFMGRDLSGFQAPAETAATAIVDKIADKASANSESGRPASDPLPASTPPTVMSDSK